MALVSAKRVKALANLSMAPGLMKVNRNLVRFSPVKLDKHNRPTFLMQPLRISRFEDETLDPVRHLEVYLRRTKYLRTSNSLFISTTRTDSGRLRDVRLCLVKGIFLLPTRHLKNFHTALEHLYGS